MNRRIFVLLQNFDLNQSSFHLFMKNKKVLIISSEVTPYLPQTQKSINSFMIPKRINEVGGQTRIFMPLYGMINERRHQLHEVIRLSGMNVVINDLDMPLIIKVASIPKERMQVYFIDNDEYFKRKGILKDSKGNLFKDNDERMIFFTKGVIETVKKLNWSPDIIHLHGWFTSLFPLYLKTYFADEAMFNSTKIVTSIYPKDFEKKLSVNLQKKVLFDNIPQAEIKPLTNPSYENLMDLAIQSSDGIVFSGLDVCESVKKIAMKSEKPILQFEEISGEDSYVDFYNSQII